MIMSTQSAEACLFPYSAESVAAPACPTWLRPLGRIRENLRRRRQLQDLIDLNDRLLADIGITREQLLKAAKAYGV
jgi:uncharacterized protein YjiS (DUF1127 family)